MAPHHDERRRARHGSSARFSTLKHLALAARQPLSRPGPLAAKLTAATAAGALAVTLAMPGGEAEATAAGAKGSAGMMAGVATLDQRTEQQASRSAARSAVAAPALKAPVAPAPQAAPTFGSMAFTAVEKPPPPPPPAPVASKATSNKSSSKSTSSKSSSSSSKNSASSSQGRSGGSGYNWAAAQACSCARGLTKNSMAVLAAVKASFPNMNNIGGVRPDSIPDHPSGRALDFMTSDRGYGDAIANMLISRSGELKIDYIIWRQRIWMPSRGWKMMSDRGGVTANHYDHVHVSVR